jgi:predicted ATP-grasp superfamily ATP-dependent carboligase
MSVPVCVIDDEHSISRFSRYATHGVRVPDLRQEQPTVETLLRIGRSLNLQGWVLFPTRDEIVAALARNRSTLAETFRVPVPEWDTVHWMLDKRNTYQLAKQLSIPFPKTWSPLTEGALDQIDSPFPLVLKPAIKEHFFYATKAKAWRINSRAELRLMFRRASELADGSEVLIQDMIPGDGRQQFSYCAFFKEGKAIGSMVTRRRRQHPHDFGRASTFVETIDLPALRRCPAVSFAASIITVWLKSNSSLTLETVNSNCWTLMLALGDTMLSARMPGSIFPVCYIVISFPVLLNRPADAPVSPGSAS